MKQFRSSLYIHFSKPAQSGLKDKKGEYYNPLDQTCYVFQLTKEDIDHVIQCINHAQLHYLIQVAEGTSKSRKFDKVAKFVRQWDKKVYEVLF